MPELAICGGTPVRTKPFPEWPVIGEADERGMLEVLRSGKWWYGEKVKQFEEAFAAYQDAQYGISCCNGTIALELALKTLGIQAGDEVLVPAYTFIATASAVLQLRAVPVFVDVDADTANMDLKLAEAAITDRTRAIIVVHFGGLPIDLDAAKDLARRRNLLLIEDAAHSWGSKWNGKGTGAHGSIGTFSFQVSKNLTAGEGGIMITDDEEIARIARSFTNVGRKEGEPWYYHYLVGGNYRITEFQASLLLSQMTRLDEQNRTRAENVAFLESELGSMPGLHLRPNDKRITRRAYHIFGFRYIAGEFGGLHRDKLVAALRAEGIPAFASYPHPVYRNPAFLELNKGERPYWRPELPVYVDYNQVSCSVAERLCSDEALWFPHTMLLGTRQDMQDVVQAMRKVQSNQHKMDG